MNNLFDGYRLFKNIDPEIINNHPLDHFCKLSIIGMYRLFVFLSVCPVLVYIPSSAYMFCYVFALSQIKFFSNSSQLLHSIFFSF